MTIKYYRATHVTHKDKNISRNSINNNNLYLLHKNMCIKHISCRLHAWVSIKLILGQNPPRQNPPGQNTPGKKPPWTTPPPPPPPQTKPP